jgi:hypothetical protein
MRAYAIALVVLLAVYHGWDEIQAQWDMVSSRNDPHTAPAIALRCADQPPALEHDCAQDLRREFEAGTQVPESIVRRHCTRYENRWAGEGEPPSDLCLQMYGGWIEG